MNYSPSSTTNWIFALVLVLIGFGIHPVIAAGNEEPFVSFVAELNYWTDYGKRPGAKAFAIGPYGNFSTAWQIGDQNKANASALASCNRSVAEDASRFHTKIKGKCVVFAEGDKLLRTAPWSGVGWQAPAIGPDHPLFSGRELGLHDAKPIRGILVQLHGCDGIGGDLAAKAWGKYLNSLRFNFFEPDSFAEPRPKGMCGNIALSERKTDDAIMRIRLAQTQRSIQELKSENPGVPIYIWGHSEGAFVAMALQTKVNGIILSGEECDAYGLPIAIPEEVPILFIYGEFDPYFAGVRLPLTQKKLAKCQKYIGNRKLDTVVVKNAAHFLRPWRQEVAEAFSRFLTGAKIAPLPEAQHLAVSLSSEGIGFMVKYSKLGKHKAFAAHPDGTFNSVSGVDYVVDAEHFAALQCDFDRGVNAFAEGKHSCTIQDVDGVASPTK
jgi:hypothetical protein